jgi:hypothetical protein
LSTLQQDHLAIENAVTPTEAAEIAKIVKIMNYLRTSMV